MLGGLLHWTRGGVRVGARTRGVDVQGDPVSVYLADGVEPFVKVVNEALEVLERAVTW